MRGVGLRLYRAHWWEILFLQVRVKERGEREKREQEIERERVG